MKETTNYETGSLRNETLPNLAYAMDEFGLRGNENDCIWTVLGGQAGAVDDVISSLGRRSTACQSLQIY